MDPSSRLDITFLAECLGRSLRNQSYHLACFAGGNFMLGGKVLGQQKYVGFGLALVDCCHDQGGRKTGFSEIRALNVPDGEETKRSGEFLVCGGHKVRFLWFMLR